MCAWLDAVGDLAGAVARATPLPTLLGLIARTAVDLTGYEASAVLLADDHVQRLHISGSAGLPAEYVAQVNDRRTIVLTSGPLAGGPSSRAFLTATPVIIHDILDDPSFAPWAHLAHDFGYRAVVAVPLVVAGVPAGTLNCYRTSVHDFGPEEIALLRTLASQAGTALQNSTLITKLTVEQRLSEQSEAIHREFTEVALRAGGVQGVAEVLARLVSTPVLVVDADGLVVANVPHGGVQLAQTVHDVDDVSDSAISDVVSAGRVVVPVKIGRELVARLWLPGDLESFAELDKRAMEHAALVCALEFLRQRTVVDVEWSLRSDLLADLLGGTYVESLASRAVSLGHNLASAYTVIVAGPDAESHASTSRMLLSTVRSIAAQVDPRPLVTAVEDNVVSLWPETKGADARFTAERIRQTIDRLPGSGTVTVVVGHRCVRIEEARASVGTARGAIELAKLRGSNRVITLPDLGVYGLLLQLDDPREVVRFAHATLSPLLVHDERKGSQLVLTLRAFLDNGMNVGRTAKALFVHQNTVGLRLKRVEDLVDCSLQDSEALLRLKVALMADDVFGGEAP